MSLTQNEGQKTKKPVTYNPDSMVKGIIIVSYYRKFIALLFLTNILMCISLIYMMNSFSSREKEFLYRLKTRDVIVMDGDSVKVAKVGIRGHRVVRKFVLDSVKDLLSYSADNFEDAIKTAQMVATPELSEKFKKSVIDELEMLKNRGGYYLIKFKDINVKKSGDEGDWLVNLNLNRIYKNELKEKEVTPIKVSLSVKDTNNFARANIDKEVNISEIGMLITQMTFNYI